MADVEREVQELKKEVIEARNVVIKTDNRLKGLHSEIKAVADKQRSFERKSFLTGAAAYLMIGALAALGAFMFARGGLRAEDEELKSARAQLDLANKALAQMRTNEQATKDESARSLALFEQLSGNDPDARHQALAKVAAMKPVHLTQLEVLALEDKAKGLLAQEAADALLSGKQSFGRHDYRTAAGALGRYVSLIDGPPDAEALFDLGQARHGLKDFAGAVDPLRRFMQTHPGPRSGATAMLLLGESLAMSGQPQEAIRADRDGANRYPASPEAAWMRARARRLERQLKAAQASVPSAPAPPSKSAAVPNAERAPAATPLAPPRASGPKAPPLPDGGRSR